MRILLGKTRQHLSPLRLRFMGPPVAAAVRHRQRYCRALCGRQQHEAGRFLADLKARLARFVAAFVELGGGLS